MNTYFIQSWLSGTIVFGGRFQGYRGSDAIAAAKATVKGAAVSINAQWFARLLDI